MAKTDFTAALGALSILARTASDIHSANLAVEEKNRDRLFAEEQSKLAKQHEINMQNDRQQHDIDQSRTAYQRETLGLYPTAEFDQDGDLIPTSIDISQSMDQRSKNYDMLYIQKLKLKLAKVLQGKSVQLFLSYMVGM